jgi:two-component system, NtrC family, nitrogen regulation response regulator NtrX
MALDLLVVDDEQDIRRLIAEILRDEGYDCREVGSADAALAAIEQSVPDLIILDIWLQGSSLDGLEVLERVIATHADLPVIMISGHADIETAVNAIKIGAYDFIEKPFKADRLLILVKRALDAARLTRELASLRQRISLDSALIGKSLALIRLRAAIDRVAPTESRVLIFGPAGAGKEVVARMLHENSRRADGPFIVLNCAMMAPDRMEVELFGRETGNAGEKSVAGTLEQADGGTLLLDEVADMPLETQGKIVRVLQEQRFPRVGGSVPVEVDVRVIASTNKDLRVRMAEGLFREDLFYRLSVVPLEIPALKLRPDDIPVLLDHFMTTVSRSAGSPPRPIADDAMAALQSYDWPGNVRQLRNVVDWILIMASGAPGAAVGTDDLPPEIGAASPVSMKWEEGSAIMGLSLRQARERFERQYLKAQISRFGGNISKTASFVGMERSALHRKLKSLGIHGVDMQENDVLTDAG